MIEIRLPELSASTAEATLVAWHKRVGDAVRPGDLLAEVETDKSTVELEAEAAGVLAEILIAEGTEGVAVGTLLARMRAAEDTSERVGAAPAPGPVAAEEPSAANASPPAVPASPPPPPSEALRATPLARRMAAQARLDLGELAGSGHGGRIVRLDVERALGGQRRSPSAAPPSARGPAPATASAAVLPVLEAAPPGRDERLSVARRTAAERLAEAKRTAPHFYLDVECDAERLLALRRELNEGRDADGGPALTVNDLLVRIAALALRRVPEANVSWRDGGLRMHERVDLAVAVASERGLVTPVVRGADGKGLGAIARELHDLVARAQQGRLLPEEYAGGTATLSNLGMYGVRRLFPILNVPQACILGVGAVEPRVVAREGQPVVRRTAIVTLAADHRAIDGAIGARLLAAFRSLVESPATMLL